MYKRASKSSLYLLCILFAGFCLFGYLLVHTSTKHAEKHSIFVGKDNQYDIFSVDSYNAYPMTGQKDPFSSKDFVKKKLSHLVFLTRQALHPKLYFNTTEHSLKSKATLANFSYVLDDLIATVNVRNFFSYSWGCKEVHGGLQMQEMISDSRYKYVHQGIYNIYRVSVEFAKADVDELISASCGSSDSVPSQENRDRCFLLKNRKILEEASMLLQLSHPNVVKVLGLCVERTESIEHHGEGKPLSSAGVVVIKETGTKLNMEQLKMLSWEKRLKICLDLATIAHHFSTSDLGSLLLTNWSPDNFVQSFKSGVVKLAHIDQALYVSEPPCSDSNQCRIEGAKRELPCEEGRCLGYNSKRNLFELNRLFFSHLLQYGIPEKDTEQISKLLVDLQGLELWTPDVLARLRHLLPDAHDPRKQSGSLSIQEPGGDNNPAILSMKRLPDGSLVDSWEQHEVKVSINEVNLAEIAREEAHEPIKDADSPAKNQDKKVSHGFRKIENADYPGRYDYYCPFSKAEWGCVMSLQTTEEAISKCLNDAKCKAFVTVPHLRKEGWIIAILKSESSKPVDHAGTTVYIRRDDNLAPSPHATTPVVMPSDKVDCLNDPATIQRSVRAAREAALMEACGWKGMTDAKWTDLVAGSKVEDASTFKPARGKLAVGGQMNIKLRHDSAVKRALFLAKRGPEEYEVSQLAVYQVDRMLGLYKTVPAIERLLTEAELVVAGFPVDIGGNQFDQFRQLKNPDKSLRGVIVPQIPERVTVIHYISVPRLSGITNAVTPFSKKQWDDLEYLLLGYLASIPVPAKGHQSVHGHLVHVKTDDAFLSDSDDYMSYLYNCQFPAHVVATMRYAVSNHCPIDAQIRTRLLVQGSPQIAKALNRNIKRLLQLVDQCIAKFGKETVLYETRSS